MSETQTQTQPESQTTQTQTYNVKIYYVIHNDDFYSRHLQPIIVRYIGRIYNIFVKERIGRPDAYYVISNKVYVKLWRDYKGHLLTFISDKSSSPMFFVRDADIIQIDENIIYEHDMRRLKCINKDVILKGFDIIKALDEVEPELLPPTFVLLCYRLL